MRHGVLLLRGQRYYGVLLIGTAPTQTTGIATAVRAIPINMGITCSEVLRTVLVYFEVLVLAMSTGYTDSILLLSMLISYRYQACII